MFEQHCTALNIANLRSSESKCYSKFHKSPAEPGLTGPPLRIELLAVSPIAPNKASAAAFRLAGAAAALGVAADLLVFGVSADIACGNNA